MFINIMYSIHSTVYTDVNFSGDLDLFPHRLVIWERKQNSTFTSCRTLTMMSDGTKPSMNIFMDVCSNGIVNRSTSHEITLVQYNIHKLSDYFEPIQICINIMQSLNRCWIELRVAHNERANKGVQYIIDAVIEALARNTSAAAARRFTYVETAFFFRWWRQQSASRKQLVRSLVSQGTRTALHCINNSVQYSSKCVQLMWSVDE